MGFTFQHTAARRRLGCRVMPAGAEVCFNTQPPEGGWLAIGSASVCKRSFQHTAARRRLDSGAQSCALLNIVSTHSRPKAAGGLNGRPFRFFGVSTHTRPKAAGFPFSTTCLPLTGFNTQPPEGGWLCPLPFFHLFGLFQHTAARRRLEPSGKSSAVNQGFNTQPPEGGWLYGEMLNSNKLVSTHSRPKAAGA